MSAPSKSDNTNNNNNNSRRPVSPSPKGKAPPVVVAVPKGKGALKARPKASSSEVSKPTITQYSCRLSHVTSPVLQYLREQRVPVEEKEGGSGSANSHPRSHAVREYATYQALQYMRAKKLNKITSLYSAPRDEIIDRVTRSLLVKLNRLTAEESSRMSLLLYRPIITGKDIGRGTPNMTLEDSDGYLCVDLYDTPMGPFSISWVKSMLTRESQYLVWVGKQFDGDGDVHDLEGAWIRLGDGKILYRADTQENQYAPHSDPSWIFMSNSAEGVVWNVLGCWGSQRAVVFQLGAPPVPTFNMPFKNHFLENCVFDYNPPINSWSAAIKMSVMRIFRKVTAPFSWHKDAPDVKIKPVFKYFGNEILSRGAILKSRTSIQLYEITSNLIGLVEKDPRYQIFKVHFPEIAIAALENTKEYICLELGRSGVDVITTLANVSNAWDSYTTALKTAGNPRGDAAPISHWWSVIPLTVGALACVYIGYRLARWGAPLPISRGIGSPMEPMQPVTQFASFAEEDPVAWARFVGLVKAHNLLVTMGGRPMQLSRSMANLLFTYCAHRLKDFRLDFAQYTRDTLKCYPDLVLRTRMTPMVRDLIFPRPVLQKVWKYSLGLLLGCFSATLAVATRLSRAVKDNYWLHFKAHYYDPPASTPLVLNVGDTGSHPFEPLDGIVPSTIIDFPAEVSEHPVVSDTRVVLKRNFPVATFAYWIMPTSIPAFSYNNDGANVEFVFAKRILREPPLDPVIQEERWRKLPMIPAPRLVIRDDELEESLEWLEHMTSKRRGKYLPLVALMAVGTLPTPYTIKCMVKGDEMLVKLNQVDGRWYVEHGPRAISNVAPELQVCIGPTIYKISQGTKELYPWNSRAFKYGKPIREADVYIRWYYAAGASDLQLSAWFRDALNSKLPMVITLGDDMLVAVTLHVAGKEYRVFLEGDASQFDQSQSTGPLSHEFRFMRKAGASTKVIRQIWGVHKSPFLLSTRARRGVEPTRRKVNMSNRPIRLSGCSDTTFGNSYSMANACFHLIHRIYEKKGVMEPKFLNENEVLEFVISEFAYLGFKIKLQVHYEPANATFLKGSFLPLAKLVHYKEMGEFTHFWSPLPSRLLKMGKTMSDPRISYKEKDLRKAGRYHIEAVCSTLRPGVHGPILRKFISRFSHHRSRPETAEEWQITFVTNGEFIIDDIAAMVSYSKRYGITTEQLEDFMMALETWDPYTVLDHPFALKMAATDYN